MKGWKSEQLDLLPDFMSLDSIATVTQLYIHTYMRVCMCVYIYMYI